MPGIPEGPSFDEPAETEPETCGEKHLGLVVVESVAPTCTEPGLSSYEYCTVCGYETEPIEISALGHELVHHAEVPATCTAEGQTAYDTCARCDYATASQTIAPTGHSYGDWVVVEEATCTETGTEEKTCASCGEKETRTIAAKGHTLGEETIEPLPDSKCLGRSVRKCTACDYVEKSSYPVHRPELYEKLEDIPATCTQPGKKNRKYCPYCREERFSYVMPLGHEFSEERTYEEGTCVTPGISYRKCVHDGCTERIDVQETAKAEGHQWEDYEVAATCTQPGFEGKKCAHCDMLDGREIDPLGHKYGMTVVRATCTDNGMKKEVCSVCGDTQETILPATGEHQWVRHPEKAASCMEDGHSEYTQCLVCGAYKDGVKPEIYQADGTHTWAADISLFNSIKETQSFPYCNCPGYGWDGVFVECETPGCRAYSIAKAPTGHSWGESSESCSFMTYVKNGKAFRFIQFTAFLLEEDWEAPRASENVRVFDVSIGKETCKCVLMGTRGSEAAFSNFAPKIPGDYTWCKVEAIDPDGTIDFAGINGSDPFYKSDCCIYMAVPADKAPAVEEKKDQGKTPETETAPELPDDPAETDPDVEDGPASDGAAEQDEQVIDDTEIPADIQAVLASSRCTMLKKPAGSNASGRHEMVWETTSATCTAAAQKSGHCAYCDFVITFYCGKPLGHSFSGELKEEPATCTERGYKYWECRHEGCVERKLAEYTVDALGHDWKVETVPATCTKPGVTKKVCNRCSVEEITVTSSSIAHQFVYKHNGDNVRAQDGVEGTDGTETERCVHCGMTRNTRNAYHQIVEVPGTPAEEIDCGQTGWSSHKECSLCGKHITEPTQIKGAHKWDGVDYLYFNGKLTPSSEVPSCTAGYIYHKCGLCSASQSTEWKSSTGHNWGDDGRCQNEGCKRTSAKNSGAIWTIGFKADTAYCAGFGGQSFILKSYRSDVKDLTMEAPAAKEGYVFKGWKVEGTLDQDIICGETTLGYGVRDMDKTLVAVYAEGTEAVVSEDAPAEISDEDEAAPEAAAGSEPEAAETPQVIHGEIEVDLFGSTDSLTDSAGHEEHAVTEHEDPLVESEDTAAIEAELAG